MSAVILWLHPCRWGWEGEELLREGHLLRHCSDLIYCPGYNFVSNRASKGDDEPYVHTMLVYVVLSNGFMLASLVVAVLARQEAIRE